MLQTQNFESLGMLVGGVAHDLNNLMGMIIGSIELSLLTMTADAPERAYMENVIKATTQSTELIHAMMAYTGKTSLESQECDISDLTRDSSVLLRPAIPKNIELKLDLAHDLPQVFVYKTQIQQVIMNLVINATEAVGGNSGKVTLSTGNMYMSELAMSKAIIKDRHSGDGKYVYFEVHDTGCGIDSTMISQIFKPHVSTKSTGHGIGLAAVYEIIKQHQGTILVESEPGKYTSMRVLLKTIS